MPELAPQLIAARQARGMTKTATAAELGISPRHLWNLEAGRSRRPSVALSRRIARFVARATSDQPAEQGSSVA